MTITSWDRRFRRVEPYLGTLLATGFLSFVARQSSVLGLLGWPEAIFVGLIGALLFTAALALWRYFHPLPIPAPAPPASTAPLPDARQERRELIIGSSRGLILAYNGQGYFSDFLERNSAFMHIRRYLDPRFLRELKRLRHTEADEPIGAALPTLARRWQEEVDKVATEWGIE